MLRRTFILFFLIWDSFVIFMQVTQQVFMAEEWVWDAHNEARAKAHSHAETEKSLGALKQEQTELANKLTTTERARLSAEA